MAKLMGASGDKRQDGRGFDTVAPAAPEVALANDTGTVENYTSDGDLAVTPSEPGGAIEYSIDGGETWIASFTATEGINTVLVRQVDDAGNVGEATEFTFTLDTIAPAAPSVSLANDTGTTDNYTSDGTLAVTTAEPDGTIEYSIDGGATWTDSFAAVEGANTVLLRQVDGAGNAGAASEFTFTLDTIPPDATTLLAEAATLEDTARDLDLLANVADPERSIVSIVALAQPENGTVTLNPDGTVRYVPNDDFSGTDRFSYTVADGAGLTTEATLDVAVAAVADEPTLHAPATLSATAGETVVFELAAMVTDLDGSESLTVIVEQLPQGATLSAGMLQDDGSWILGPGDLEGLQVSFSSDAVGSHVIGITAVATETSNSDTAATSQQIELAIAAATNDHDEDSTVVSGTGEDDVFFSAAGDHYVIGRGGFDTAVYEGNIDEYEISKNADGTIRVRALLSDEGTDDLQAVEAIRFADASFDAVRGRVLAAAAQFDGTVLNDGTALINGGSGDQVMLSGYRDTEFRGGGGFDSVVYTGNIEDYEITKNSDGTMTVRALVSDEGTDVLATVEAIRFADATYDAVRGRVLDSAETFDGQVLLDGTAMLQGGPGDDVQVAGFRDTGFHAGGGYDWMVYKDNRDDYEITRNDDGTVTVRALLSDEGTDTLLSVETLRFADQDLILVDDSSTPDDPAGDSDLEIVKPDPMLQPAQSHEIVGLRLVNTTESQSQDGYLTFGHVFAKGDLPANAGLVARMNGTDIPIQLDVKATHGDGSVRHAVLTMQAPALDVGAEIDVMLARVKPLDETALDPMSLLDGSYDLQLKLTVEETDGALSTHVIDAGALVAEAFAAGDVSQWLTGPMAAEFSVSTAVNDLLDARFDIRVYANGEVRTDVIVSNYNTYGTTAPRTVVYDVEIMQDGQGVFSAADVSHHRNSNWHKEVWAGDGPPVHLQYNNAYLVATGGIPAIDVSLGSTESALAGVYSQMQQSDTGLLGSSLLQQKMGGGGGRPDIGPMTAWASQYLGSQDARALEVMLAQADAAGSIPWHFQDVETGEWVSIDEHPMVWTLRGDTEQFPAFGSDGLPAFDPDTGGWGVDQAHQPAGMLLPYLITGSQYYGDELAAQAAYNLAWMNPDYREKDVGLLELQQVRGMAWALRSLSDAAYLLPDGHALKDYFAAKFQNNLDHLITMYIEEGRLAEAGELEGWFYRLFHGDPGNTAGWQLDFVSTTLTLAYQRGFESAGELIEWTDNFIAGRFINGDNGFDPMYGAAGRIAVFDAETGELYSTWREAFEVSFGVDAPSLDQMMGWPNTSHSYVLIAKSALAGHITSIASPDAIEAYGFITNASRDYGFWDPARDDNVYKLPSWTVSPILPDGTHLTNDRVVFGSGEFSGGGGSKMLIGDEGANTIHGAEAIDIIFAIGGDNVLSGGDGNDYVFGGPGNDRVIGDRGDDYLKGGGGADTFVFDIDDSGHDTIGGWDASTDLLEIHQGINGMTETSSQDLLARIFDDGAGNAVLDLGGDNSVTLLGVEAADVTASHLHLVQ